MVRRKKTKKEIQAEELSKQRILYGIFITGVLLIIGVFVVNI